jgi:hypothetical protein
MLRVHFGTPNGVRDYRGGIGGSMCAACGGYEPVIVVGGHQHELATPMPCDLNGLALRLMLEVAELALKFNSRGLRHDVRQQ